MGLRRYRTMRDFGKTPEPSGKKRPRKPAKRERTASNGASFVVQKHDATRLHYDFRLEMDGVLKSWAVPKGPSLDPGERRLAVHVEDHPLEYGDFEGVIPEGEYGGGPVIVWDRGTWTPHGDAAAGYRRGSFAFDLEGEKLRGAWTLVRLAPRDGERGGKENWLLIKKKDAHAKTGEAAEVTRKKPASVKTGRRIERLGAKEQTPRRAAVARFAKRASPTLTHPDRVLWPEVGVTKKDLAEDYRAVAPRMLPWAAGRPLMLLRCPEGHAKGCFVQKHATGSLPPGIGGVRIDGEEHLTIDSLEGLLGLVQMGTLEIHGWGAKADRVERPDLVVFDLDPAPDVPFARVVEAARDLRDLLEDIGLASFPKTTGGKGLHVVVPLAREHPWDEVKDFCHAVALRLVADAPDRYLAQASKAKRKGKIFIDWLRNGRGATAVLPYSTRARPGAPVATPLAWKEVVSRLDPSKFHVSSVPRRVKRLGKDPWAGMPGKGQRLGPAALRLLESTRAT